MDAQEGFCGRCNRWAADRTPTNSLAPMRPPPGMKNEEWLAKVLTFGTLIESLAECCGALGMTRAEAEERISRGFVAAWRAP